jgi:hypothetical protein
MDQCFTAVMVFWAKRNDSGGTLRDLTRAARETKFVNMYLMNLWD